jgi:hypothetical protein
MDQRRRLIILADGALLHARNAKAKDKSTEGAGPVLDFLKVPTAIAKTLGLSGPPAASDCHWFMVGAQNASKFIETISQAWSVHEFPLRAFSPSPSTGEGQVRFTPAIAWALGNVASSELKPTVIVVSNDPGVIFPAKFTIDRGTADVMLAWPDPLSDEARHFADWNEVRVLPFDPNEVRAPGHRPSFGRTFLAQSDADASPKRKP